MTQFTRLSPALVLQATNVLDEVWKNEVYIIMVEAAAKKGVVIKGSK